MFSSFKKCLIIYLRKFKFVEDEINCIYRSTNNEMASNLVTDFTEADLDALYVSLLTKDIYEGSGFGSNF